MLVGWHDYTLSMLFDRLPGTFDGIAYFHGDYGFTVVAATALFALRPKMTEKHFALDKDFIKSLKITLGTFVLIKAASVIFDTVTTEVDLTSLNSILSYIVVPVATLIAGAVFSVITMRMLIRKTDGIVDELNIKLGKRSSAV